MDISQQNPCQLKCHSFNHFTEVYPTETLNATSLSVENKGSNKKMMCFQKRTPWRKDVKFQTIKTTNVTVNNVFLSSNYSYLKLHSSPNVLSERIAEIAPNTHLLYESYQTNRFHLLCITIKKILRKRTPGNRLQHRLLQTCRQMQQWQVQELLLYNLSGTQECCAAKIIPW